MKTPDEIMPNPCNPLTCKCYSAGYCEYDFATGQIMPMEPDSCPLLKKEGEPLHEKSTDAHSPNG